MAAQTIGDWSDKEVNGRFIATCQCTTDATNEILFTKKTPKGLDPTKPWTLIVAASAAQDGAAAPLIVHVGYAEDFALAGTTARATVTSGAVYGELTDDLGYAAAVPGMAFYMVPLESTIANVVTIAAVATGMRFNVPVASYYAFELHADDNVTLLAHTLTFTIIQ